MRDGIDGGKIMLQQVDAQKFILAYRDAVGEVKKHDAYRNEVTANAISVTVLLPNRRETYTFLRNADGEAEVLWSVHDWGTMIPKISAYRAPCGFLDIATASRK